MKYLKTQEFYFFVQAVGVNRTVLEFKSNYVNLNIYFL